MSLNRRSLCRQRHRITRIKTSAGFWAGVRSRTRGRDSSGLSAPGDGHRTDSWQAAQGSMPDWACRGYGPKHCGCAVCRHHGHRSPLRRGYGRQYRFRREQQDFSIRPRRQTHAMETKCPHTMPRHAASQRIRSITCPTEWGDSAQRQYGLAKRKACVRPAGQAVRPRPAPACGSG